MRKLFIFLFVLFTSATINAAPLLCDGLDHWDARITLTHLENAGLIKKGWSNTNVATKLVQRKKIADMIAHDGMPAMSLYQQVQTMTIKQKDEPDIELIIVGEYTKEECSMSEPAILMIAPTMMPISPGAPYLKESKALIKQYGEMIIQHCAKGKEGDSICKMAKSLKPE